jgi:hypothetical protein
MLGNEEESTQLSVQLLLNAAGNPLLLCIIGSRMFFNLKEAGKAGLNEGTNVGSHRATVSSIRFDEPNHEREGEQ